MLRTFLSAAILLFGVGLLAATLEPLDIKIGQWLVTMTETVTGLPKPITNTYKSCVKKEDLGKYPFTNPRDKCTWTVQSSTSHKLDATGTCMPANMGKVDFNIHAEAPDSETLKGTGQLTINGGPNGPMTGNYSLSAQWQGPTCPAQ